MDEGDLVLCTVERVSNTITHVRLPDGSEGTIISSEIAPGRIKHMRHYVVPHKKIVCKVLEVSGDNIHLSLRRVNSKEKKEVMQAFKQDQALTVAFNQLLTDPKKVIDKILSDFPSLSKFIKRAKADPSLLKKFIPTDGIDAIMKLLDKKRKGHVLRQNIRLKCFDSAGVSKIKEILSFSDPQISVSYISAGNFDLKLEVDDFKQGKKQLEEITNTIKERASRSTCELSISEK